MRWRVRNRQIYHRRTRFLGTMVIGTATSLPSSLLTRRRARRTSLSKEEEEEEEEEEEAAVVRKTMRRMIRKT